MDEVSLGAATMVGELKDGEVREYEIHPEDFGLQMVSQPRAEGGTTRSESKAMLLERAGQQAGRRARHRHAERGRGAVCGERASIDRGRHARARARRSRAARRARRSTTASRVHAAIRRQQQSTCEPTMSDILDRIIAVKREEIRAAEQSAPLEELRLEASARDHARFRRRVAREACGGSGRGDRRSEEGEPVAKACCARTSCRPTSRVRTRTAARPACRC